MIICKLSVLHIIRMLRKINYFNLRILVAYMPLRSMARLVRLCYRCGGGAGVLTSMMATKPSAVSWRLPRVNLQPRIAIHCRQFTCSPAVLKKGRNDKG